jgi:hypothetical protein
VAKERREQPRHSNLTPPALAKLIARKVPIKKTDKQLDSHEPGHSHQPECHGHYQIKADRQTPGKKPHFRKTEDRQDDQDQADSIGDPFGNSKHLSFWLSRHNYAFLDSAPKNVHIP